MPKKFAGLLLPVEEGHASNLDFVVFKPSEIPTDYTLPVLGDVWSPLATLQPCYYDTLPITTHFCETKLFTPKLPLVIRQRHLIVRHLESPFCHIKEVVNVKTPFIYVMYIQHTSIFAWELHLYHDWELIENQRYQCKMDMVRVRVASYLVCCLVHG